VREHRLRSSATTGFGCAVHPENLGNDIYGARVRASECQTLTTPDSSLNRKAYPPREAHDVPITTERRSVVMNTRSCIWVSYTAIRGFTAVYDLVHLTYTYIQFLSLGRKCRRDDLLNEPEALSATCGCTLSRTLAIMLQCLGRTLYIHTTRTVTATTSLTLSHDPPRQTSHSVHLLLRLPCFWTHPLVLPVDGVICHCRFWYPPSPNSRLSLGSFRDAGA
jgi:hypothetical protein